VNASTKTKTLKRIGNVPPGSIQIWKSDLFAFHLIYRHIHSGHEGGAVSAIQLTPDFEGDLTTLYAKVLINDEAAAAATCTSKTDLWSGRGGRGDFPNCCF
jgi:hypothetical protein